MRTHKFGWCLGNDDYCSECRVTYTDHNNVVQECSCPNHDEVLAAVVAAPVVEEPEADAAQTVEEPVKALTVRKTRSRRTKVTEPTSESQE